MPDPIRSLQGAQTRFRIYDEAGDATPLQRTLAKQPGADHGLRFTKFFGRWGGQLGDGLLEAVTIVRLKPDGTPRDAKAERTTPVLDWLDPTKPNENPIAFREKGEAPSLKVGDAGRLSEANARLQRLATATLDVQLVSRLLIGIGLPHPVENGLLFHPTLAVPYLRGTALKQVARAAAAAAGCNDLAALFGAVDAAGQPLGHGSLQFLDALPMAPVTLVAEQITNHYPGYYQAPIKEFNPALGKPCGDMERPADWHHPNPVTMLAVEASLAKPLPFRLGVRAPDANAAQQALDWLAQGLRDIGIGARTSMGFGRLISARQLAAEQQAKAAAAQAAQAALAAHGPPAGTRVRWLGEEWIIGGTTADGKRIFRDPDGDASLDDEARWDPRTMTVMK